MSGATGETTAIELLYREHGARLWRAVYAYSGDVGIAEDAVAEAFTQALRRGASLQDPLAWIWRVAFRVAAGELKERRRSTTPTDTSVEALEAPVDLMRALRRLSPRQRAAVLLHHYAGYSTKEIAEMLDSTSGAIRVHLSLGRARLRELLSTGGSDAEPGR